MLRSVLVIVLMLSWTAALAEDAASSSGQAGVASSEHLENASASSQSTKEGGGPVAGSRGGLATKTAGNYGIAGGGLVNTAIGLIVVLVMIIAVAFFLRRFGGLPTVRKGAVSIVGGISLGPRERAVLLQVGDTRVLVGVAPGQVRALHVFDNDGVEGEGEKVPFSQQLDGVIKGGQ